MKEDPRLFAHVPADRVTEPADNTIQSAGDNASGNPKRTTKKCLKHHTNHSAGDASNNCSQGCKKNKEERAGQTADGH